MIMDKEAAAPTRDMEWRINLPDGTWKELSEESGGMLRRLWSGLKGLVIGFVLKIWRFLEKARNIAVAEPKKAIHGTKVGLALSLVSLFYYMKPLYNGFGGNAMWAVMTVVVVFEYTVGATLSKCINRAIGTFLAGLLGVGVNWVADHSGAELEPVILGISLFILASAATFSRFIPSVKTRYDYGAMIFVLTFSLVAVSGYRVDELFKLARHRLSTIAVGTSLCIIISMLFYPTWAGDELHNIIIKNLEKLADSLDGCVCEYFKEENASTTSEDASKKLLGYKCVLNSKATEETMANFARWEPAHGKFNFRHPWKKYLIIGASLRSCAYCIETLNGCVNSDIKAPEYLKKHLESACKTLGSKSSTIFKELAVMMKTMKRSSKIEISTGDMNVAVQELKNVLRSLSCHVIAPPPAGGMSTAAPLMGIVPLATVASMLIETAARIETCVDAIEELAQVADFKVACNDKKKSSRGRVQPTNTTVGSTNSDHVDLVNKDDAAMRAQPKV